MPKSTPISEYQSTELKLYSTAYRRVQARAKAYYESLITNPRRKPNVRSKYFDHKKVFLDEFWTQILFRNLADRRRRLAFYICAIDLIKNSKCAPEIKYEKGKRLLEFRGIAKNGERFAVHLRQSKDNIYMMSCFPK